MEDQECIADEVAKMDEEEDEFRSCCGDVEECLKEEEDEDEDEESMVKMYFKGISIDGFGESGCGLTGIGVFFEKSNNFGVGCVQKRLDFYEDDLVAEYLALMDGLSEALKSNAKRVSVYTDSQVLYEQVMHEETSCNPLIAALRERVRERAASLESHCLKIVPSVEVERALQLAQVAIGLISLDAERGPVENCSICHKDKPLSMTLTLKCSHKCCSNCLKVYADGKIRAGQFPIRCPQLRCNYIISTSECKMVLPVISYEVLEKAVVESNVLSLQNVHCPYQYCSVLLDPREHLSAQASSSDETTNSRIDCPVCHRSICLNCVVPWHSSLSCEEYQNLGLEEREASGLSLHCLARDRKWRRCQQCQSVIELTQGCYHMTCWCGHEFCYACGAAYQNGLQTCVCVLLDEESSEGTAGGGSSTPETENSAWNSFDAFPMILDAYSEQERSQLALIQGFLAGGFSLTDHAPPPVQSPPPHCTDSFDDAMRDLHQLPWLERFVSVISDDHYDEYIY